MRGWMQRIGAVAQCVWMILTNYYESEVRQQVRWLVGSKMSWRPPNKRHKKRKNYASAIAE